MTADHESRFPERTDFVVIIPIGCFGTVLSAAASWLDEAVGSGVWTRCSAAALSGLVVEALRRGILKPVELVLADRAALRHFAQSGCYVYGTPDVEPIAIERFFIRYPDRRWAERHGEAELDRVMSGDD